MATESGWSNQKKLGPNQHKTIQNVGSDRYGISTAQMYLYDVTAVAVALTNSALSTDSKQIYLEIPAHGGSVGDIVRIITSSALKGWEYEIAEVIDANTVAVWKTSDSIPAIADEVKVCRWITAKADGEGALTTTAGPVQFLRNGSVQDVVEDTVTSANNRPLPVKLTGITGDINITANDLNVQIDHANDSVKIGDGTDLLAVNADGSINVLGPLTDAQLRAAAVPVSAASLPLPAGAATEAKQDAEAVLIGPVTETAPITDTASSGLNGRLQRIAQRISSLIDLLPASLGQKLMAGSLAVTVASDQSAIPVSGPLTDTQLRATAVPVSGPLTDTQLRATAVAISAAALPLPAGAATEAKQDSIIAAIGQNAGSYAESTTLDAVTAQTITAPAGAKWCKIMNLGGQNLRVKIGGAASVSSGMRLEPGRSEDFNGVGNISVIAELGTAQAVAVQWG